MDPTTWREEGRGAFVRRERGTGAVAAIVENRICHGDLGSFASLKTRMVLVPTPHGGAEAAGVAEHTVLGAAAHGERWSGGAHGRCLLPSRHVPSGSWYKSSGPSVWCSHPPPHL